MITTEKTLSNNGYKPAAQPMQASLQLLPLIMNNIPQAVFWKDRNLVYLGCNQAFADDAGLSSPNEITGKTDFDMPWKEQADLYRSDDRSVMESGVAKLNYEEPQTTPDGSTIWLRTNKIPVQENGEIVAVLGMYEDITVHKQAEQVLKQSEATLSSVLRVAQMGHWEFDLATGLFTLNDQYYSLHGRTVQEVGGYQIGVQRFSQEFVYPEDAAVVGAATQQAIETTDPNFQVRTEARIMHADGKPRWVTVWFRVEKDAQGRTIKLHGVNQDITVRKQAEAERQAEKSLSDAIINGLPGIFYLFDPEGKLIRWNNQYENVLGYTTEEIATKNALDPIADEDKERTVAAIQQAFVEGQGSVEADLITRDGQRIPYYFVGQRLQLGDQLYLAGSGIDITERKRLQTQVQEAFERRGLQVQLSTQVSQSIAAASSIEELYERVVTQVKEQFGYYHTQLLRYDPAQEAVVLVTGYGEVGAQMLAARHHLPMGQGLIGTAAATGETVLRPVLEHDPDWHSNPLLPETKGEIAVPIKLGDTILGVLDVQSNLAGALGADDQLLLEGLCGQIATAIESTRLRQEMADRLEEINRLYRAMSHEGWQSYKETAGIPSSFMFDQGLLKPVQEEGLAEELFAKVPLTVPGGETIGTFAIAEDSQRPLSADDQAFVEQVAEQVALALESARLFEQTQVALVESEETQKLIRNVIDSTDDWIFVKDRQHRYRLVNQGYARALHISVDTFIGKDDLDLGFPEELVKGNPEKGIRGFWTDDLLVMDTGMPQHFPDDPAMIDGQVRIFDTIKIPLRDANGTIWGVLAFARDLTERKMAELAIQKSEAKLSEALSIAKLANWEYDFDRDRFIFNDQFYSIFHTTAEQVGGYELSSAEYAQFFVHPDDAALVGEEIGKAVASTDQHYSAKLEHRILFADGGIGYIAVDVHIDRDENGKIIRWYGANQDITERKLAQEAITKRATELATVAQVGATASTVLDPDKLLQAVVDLTKERFSLYHAHIYLVNTEENALVLTAGAGEVGKQMIAEGWNIPVDHELSIIADAYRRRESVVANDVYRDKDSAFLSNQLLPDTRSELAVPMIVGDKVLGVFDVQSEKANIFTAEDVNIYTTLASQVAVTLQNARLFEQTQSALAFTRESETRLSEALKIAKLAHWEYDVERDIFTFNDHFYSIFHTTAEQVGGYELSSAQYVQFFVLPEDAAVVGNEIGKALASTERHFSAKLEHRILFADGQTGFISVEVHVERDETGKIIRWHGANQDITERKRAEEAIKAEQQRVQLILESVTLPMVITRLADNHLTFVNAPALEVTQFKYEEVINHPSPNFYVNAEDRKSFINELRAKGEVSNMVVQLRRINGEAFWALLSARVFNYQDEASILTTFMDITDRIRAQETAAKRATELQTVADVSATTATTLEPDRLLQSVVDQTKQRFGLYHAHIYLTDNSWNTLLLAAGAGEVGRKLVAEQHAIPLSLEQSLVARAARERKAVIVNDVNSEPGFLPNPLLPETCAEMAVPMLVGDKVLGVFDVQSNSSAGFSEEDANIYITLASQVAVALQNARLYAEQAATLAQLRELDKLKSSFLANMSHELRTPLNSILGFTDVIMEGLDGPLTEHMDSDLRLIQKNGQHLLHLINDVLDMAKIEAGRMNLNPESFRAFEVLEEVASITSTLASEKNLSLYLDETSDRQVKIYADRTRLRQVMINLVNNSIKFTEMGKISIKVTPMEGARILITVKDTGIGIDPNKLDAIFQEFTQVDSSTTRKAGGTGLGLPISRRLVEMHGGRLWADSNGIPGEGSTFFVEMPVEARITEVVEKQEK